MAWIYEKDYPLSFRILVSALLTFQKGTSRQR